MHTLCGVVVNMERHLYKQLLINDCCSLHTRQVVSDNECWLLSEHSCCEFGCVLCPHYEALKDPVVGIASWLEPPAFAGDPQCSQSGGWQQLASLLLMQCWMGSPCECAAAGPVQARCLQGGMMSIA